MSATVAGSALLAWTSLGFLGFQPIRGRQDDYYNLLVSGFRKGSLALDVKVPDALKNAEDPWNPAKRPPDVGMHDISYKNGHYYLYFGVVPAVVLFWPFRLITGNDLPFVYSSVVFSLGAFLTAAWLWLRVIRDHFPRSGLVTRLGGLAAVGLAGGQLDLARRASIWEMPIAAGHFYIVCTLASGYLALRSRRPWAWLAVAGASLGLAVGCRPTLAAAGAGLAVLVLAVGWDGRAGGSGIGILRRTALAAISTGLPLAAILACLLAYNKARFGSPFEFGINYQLSGSFERQARHFSLSYIPYNFWLYFLKLPQWGRYFPFLHPIRFSPQPSGYYGYEFVYGSLVVCPVLWWAAFLPAWLRRLPARAEIGAFASMVAAMAVPTTLLLLCFNTAAARYTVDFLPWWVWLGALGWAVLEARVGSGRGSLAFAFGSTAAVSLVLAFCASVELHGLLQYWNPSGYRKLARVFDAPVALEERVFGSQAGPVEMDVTFAPRPLASYEPLITTGVEYQKNYVFVYYQSDTVVRLGYASAADSPITSKDITIVPGRKYRVRVECGSLYPPEGILYFRGWKVSEINSLKGWVRIEVAGTPVLTARRAWDEATPGSIEIGRDSGVHRFGQRFAGTISGVRRESGFPPVGEFSPGGDVKLELGFPDEGLEGTQPLISAGKPGKADIMGIAMPDMGHIELQYESWGIGIRGSSPIALPKSRMADLRVRFGPLLRVNAASPLSILKRSIVVWMDGELIWSIHTSYPLDPSPSSNLSANEFGSSAMAKSFQGRVEFAVNEPPPAPWRAGPFSALELDLVGRGEGKEPLVTTGEGDHADMLAIEWLPGGRARLLYAHSGGRVVASPPFDWSEKTIHVLRAGMPSLPALDAKEPPGVREGVLRVALDGASVWEPNVPYFPATSASVSAGLNSAGLAAAGPELRCAVAGLRQAPE